jgi:hypothetical protein
MEETAVSDGHALEALREYGDLQMQRRHVWEVISRLTDIEPGKSEPHFESWYGEDQVFASDAGSHLQRGIRGFSRGGVTPVVQSGGVPVLSYTLYNASAYNHIRNNRLHSRIELTRLQNEGAADSLVPNNRTVPAFPTNAIVLKTVWWPVAGDAITALPVWDPDLNPPRQRGNDYTSWRRVVAIDPQESAHTRGPMHIDFAGRSFDKVRRIGVHNFYHIIVDERMAGRLMRDREARRVALIALGRNMAAGDLLVLVGANLATREINNWVWAAMWWHDRAEEGSYAADRPASVQGLWRNYLMQAAFDSEKPLRPDGLPHICFNPWLEGRFPDQGRGGGTVSNCVACHSRASYPAVGFLPVTRGGADMNADPAYLEGRLRTSFLWSLALHAVQ